MDRPADPAGDAGRPPLFDLPDATVRHNLLVESWFSAFHGVFMAMILFTAQVVAVTCLEATDGQREIISTMILCAFPCGAFLGPLWAGLGRRWGMQKLVTRMGVWANLPLFFVFWVENAWLFTAIIVLSQLLFSSMRMGQSSMYQATYPRPIFGRVLGILTFWSFLTMVPSVLLSGWVLDRHPDSYRWLFPLAGACGLIACRFYARLRAGALPSAPSESLRRSLARIHRVFRKDRAFRSFEIAFFLSGSAFFMCWHVMFLLSNKKLGLDAADLALWLVAVPQIVLAITSPLWGRIMDRIGIVRARLLVAAIMTVYLVCYALGVFLTLPILVYIGSVLRGVSEGGGQVTWALASVHFAPSPEEVPTYNGIHFILNGIRGLLMTWVGTLIFQLMGAWNLVAATLVSASAVVVIFLSLRHGEGLGHAARAGRTSEIVPPPVDASGRIDSSSVVAEGAKG
jgi:MFS family permease